MNIAKLKKSSAGAGLNQHCRFLGCLIFSLALVVSSAITSAAENPGQPSLQKAEAGLPEYSPAQRIDKSLTSIGSDSMGDLVDRWVEAYSKVQPVLIKVEHQGSASAPAALIEGAADLGPMAREMKPAEKSSFVARYGFQPTQVRTALAVVAVYVSKKNPIREITFDQLNAIYSAQPKNGTPHPDSWRALLHGAGTSVEGDPEIYALAANMDPYAYAYFRQQVLAATDLDGAVTSTGDVHSMLELVASKPNAIGFGLLTAAPPGVKILAVRRGAEDKAVMPDQAELLSEAYPLGRYLNVYVIQDPQKGPEKSLDEGVKDFLSFVLSKQGQLLVAKEGLLPLPQQSVAEERSKLGL